MFRRRPGRSRHVRHAAAVSLVATAGMLATYLGSPRLPQAYARPGAPFEAMFAASDLPELAPRGVRTPRDRLRTWDAGAVWPMDLPNDLTCDFSVDDSVGLQTAVAASLDDSVICITADIPDLSEQMVIDDTSLTIIGAAGDDSTTSITLTADDTRHIHATFDDTESFLTLMNITFTGGSVDDSGGSIYIAGARASSQGTELRLLDDTFVDNTAGGSGGAIYAKDLFDIRSGTDYNSSTLKSSIFEGNRSDSDGGAIYARNAEDVVLYGGSFTRNYAAGRGGGIAVRRDNDYTLIAGIGTAFVDDSAGIAGGAIAADGTDQVTLLYFLGSRELPSVFSGNSAPTGGAVWMAETGSGANAFWTYGALQVRDNSATAGDGGAILVANDDSSAGPPPGPGPFGDQLRFRAVGYTYPTYGVDGYPTFTGNTATGDGGAVHVTGLADAGGVLLREVVGDPLSVITFTDNSSSGSGGAMYVDGTVLVDRSSFVNNASDDDGGAIAVGASTPGSTSFPYRGAFINGGYFTGNSAPGGSGGGIYVGDSAGDLVARSSTFAGNDAMGYGGALFGDDTVFVDNSTLTGNQSVVGAGAIGSYGAVLVDFSTITDNATVGIGGGIYATTVTVTNSIVQRNRADGIVGGAGPAEPNPQDVLAYRSVVDSFSLFTSPGDVFARYVVWSPGVGSLFTSQPVVGSLGDNGGFLVSDDTVIPTMMPLATSPILNAANPSFTGSPTTYDQRGEGFLRVVGPRADLGAVERVSTPPPPPPIPATPPRDISVESGDAEVTVTWQAPASSGSFPVTNYRAVATIEGQQAPESQSCLALAPTLTCTIIGLTNGTTYTVRVQALTGAGWSALSAPSEPVTPQAPITQTIVITGTRERIEGKKTVIVNGTTTGLVGQTVTARVRLQGQVRYSDGSTRIVDDAGLFTWQRITGKTTYVYFIAEDGSVRSQRIIIRR